MWSQDAYASSVGAALIVALVSATTVASASAKFDYTTSIDDTGELVVSFEERSLKRFDGVSYRLEALGELVTPTRRGGGQALVETESPLVPDANGRVTGSLTTTLGLLFLAPCGCGEGRYIEYTNIVLTNLATGHMYRLNPIRRDI
jgi:hypothetical protein